MSYPLRGMRSPQSTACRAHPLLLSIESVDFRPNEWSKKKVEVLPLGKFINFIGRGPPVTTRYKSLRDHP